MRTQPLLDVHDKQHSVPIAIMGNFQEAIKNRVELCSPRDENMQSGVHFVQLKHGATSNCILFCDGMASTHLNDGIVSNFPFPYVFNVKFSIGQTL